ncbi:MAG TPA: hypothetical protein PKE57_11855 [Cellvibrionaceae bacterium]|nr:hypothetical protein [Cellvibrionaceae bacterium]HMW48558.1 hypothetical protein [Cellvibrionaceae bacterium]HMW70528.1 hypothetical protein [Cellvibrionaceae bacterium]HMY37955.1 hypothetical protein [Marinagarivorans sp.]HNG60565.1 hypothetical protein [Cellvibrionaceae bacterium]
MCPVCAAGIGTWLLAGGAGGGVVLTTTYALVKSRSQKAILKDKNKQPPIKNAAS